MKIKLRMTRNFVDIASHSQYLLPMENTHITRRGLLAAMPLILALPATAFAQSSRKIVATTGMIADAARRIGGGDVTALMGPGVDPHSYRQTRSDIAALVRADLVLWHG
jgi:manganese/zinc/iron transport system substrate-binding protein